MHLVKPTAEYFFLFIVLLLISVTSFSQENSPFSRYGIGDIYPQQTIASRGMGGISAAYASTQAINTINPASYGSMRLVTYDFGVSIDAKTLASAAPPLRYKSTNFIPSYLLLGVPLSKATNVNSAGLIFGLRPATRINYGVEEGRKIFYDSLGITDSVHSLYEGNGGLNQVFFGLGKTWRNKKQPFNSFSVGFNFGYSWGTKFISTKIDFPSDSSYENWYRSNSTDTSRYWGLFFNPGVMASFKLKESEDPVSKLKNNLVLSVGASATLKQDLNASRDITRQTFFYNDAQQVIPIDSVSKISGIHGKINIPVNYTGGFMLNEYIINGPIQAKKWGAGIDYSFAPWTKYLFYGEPDQLNDSWMIRAGVEFSPNPLGGKSIFSSGTYRLGYYNGKDYINADGNGYKVQAVTLGYQFNLRRYHSYDNQFTMINTSFEFGKRGTNVNNVTENFFKFSVGLSLSDIWFIKRKYD